MLDWACPPGWAATPVGPGETWEFSACAPPVSVACEGATGQFPGDSGCEPIGTPCPGGDGFLAEEDIRRLADDDASPLLWVRSEAAGRDDQEDADGSRALPFATMEEALRAAPAGPLLVTLAEGEHDFEVEARDRRLSLVGACASGTFVGPRQGPTDSAGVSYRGTGGGAVANITFRNKRIPLSLRGSTPARVEDVAVLDSMFSGVFIDMQDAQLVLRRVVIRRVSRDGGEVEGLGLGLISWTAGVLDAQDLLVEQVASAGIQLGVGDSAFQRVRLARVAIRGASPGIIAVTSAFIDAAQVLIEGCTQAALMLGGEAPHLPPLANFDDLAIRGFRAYPGASANAAVLLSDASRLVANRLLVEDTEGGAFFAAPSGIDSIPPTAELTDVVIRGTRPADVPRGAPSWTTGQGIALRADYGASVRVERGAFVDQRHAALLATGGLSTEPSINPGSLELIDVVTKDTAGGRPPYIHGRGLMLTNGAVAQVLRMAVSGSEGSGVSEYTSVGAPGCRLTGSDLTVRDTASDKDGFAGYGLFVGGSKVDLERVTLVGNRERGLYATGGEGLPETDVGIRHLSVAGTAAASCADAGGDEALVNCAQGSLSRGGGAALVIRGGAKLAMSEFSLTGSAHAGLVVSQGFVTASRETISDNAVGLVTLDEEFDLESISDEVFIFDNALDVSRDALPIPDPSALFEVDL